MRVVRGRSVVVVLAAVALLTAGLVWGLAASFAASPSPSAGGKLTLKLGILTPPDNLNPFVGYENSSFEVWCLNYDFLVGYAPDGSPQPGIAESWSTSPDGKTWTFHIRHGVTWQDGVPLTARDVAFTFNYIVQKQLSAYDFYTKLIKNAVATDDYTCEVHCTKPKADMLRLYIYVFPQHIWSKIANPEKYRMTYPIVGSGPFQTMEYKEGSYVRLERNPTYWGTRPAIDEVLFQVYTNQDTMVQEFKMGLIDGAFGVPPAQYPGLAATPGVQAFKSNLWYFEYLAFNTYDQPGSLGNPVLRDVRFRQALEWAIDKQQLVKIGLSGFGQPGSTMMPPGEWPPNLDAHYQPTSQEAFGFDIAKANQLLDAAGYKDTNGDDIRDYKGKPIVLRLWGRSESTPSQIEGKLITSWFRKCGLKISFTIYDNGTVSDKLYSYKGNTYTPDYDMYLWDNYGYADPGDTLAQFTTAQIQMWNDACWSSPTYDALNERQMSELDAQKRLALVHQMQQVIYVQSPYSVLTYPENLSVVNTSRWQGWVSFMHGTPFYNAYNIDSYLQLRPKEATAGSSGTSGAALWIVVGVIAVLVVGGLAVVFVRRGRKRAIEE
jgi:peptide/nickel transport system substrate-binding protein